MSCAAMAFTASITGVSGATVKSVLPLIRRISLTTMPTSVARAGRCRLSA